MMGRVLTMSNKDSLEEIINDLPYSIRYSGEIEPLKEHSRKQAERVEKLEENAQDLREALGRRQEQIKRYREALLELNTDAINSIKMETELSSVFVKNIIDEALEDESE